MEIISDRTAAEILDREPSKLTCALAFTAATASTIIAAKFGVQYIGISAPGALPIVAAGSFGAGALGGAVGGMVGTAVDTVVDWCFDR